MAWKKRRHTVAQKLEILEEARAPGATVAEACRRHGIDGTTSYGWEKQAKAGMREALNGTRRAARRDRHMDARRSPVEKTSACRRQEDAANVRRRRPLNLLYNNGLQKMRRQGIEPRTYGLRVRCSAN